MEKHIHAFQEEIQMVMLGSAVPADVFGRDMLINRR
jgi:hypothetical protein